MKFNTLTFDANLPTVQQVNVPTNSDYKVGMKVKRNGTIQSIKPSEFTITGTDGTTLSADSEKTNGYVTITKDSGDEATFKQFGVHINHGYDFNDEISNGGQCPAVQGDYKCQVKVVAGEVGLAGLTIKPEDIEYAQALNSATPIDPTTLTWQRYIDYIKGIGMPNSWVISELPDSNEKWSIFWNEVYDNVTLADGRTIPLERNKAYFFKFTPTAFTAVAEELVLPAGATFQGRAIKFNANKYWFQGFRVKAGTPFSADFKLNINEFKSQSGDIAETLADGSSVKVDGTYADGTTFSFDFCTK